MTGIASGKGSPGNAAPGAGSPSAGVSPGPRAGSRFLETLAAGGPVLLEGGVVERVRRGGEARLDPHLANARLVLEERGRAVLEGIYRSYLDVARRHRLPILVLSPTWRASGERARRAGIPEGTDLNGEAVRFLAGVAERSGVPRRDVHVGGLLGCRGDAYRAEEGLGAEEAEEHHRPQALALAAAGAEFLLASTMPALPEAVGMARALAATGTPYLVSFLARETGALLDGTPLDEAIDSVDAAASPPPGGFLVNCVHPSVLRLSLGTPHAARSARTRLLGLQANTSALRPEELEGRAELAGAEPEAFAEALVSLRDDFGLRLLGGCCGTDERHVEAVARRLAGTPPGGCRIARPEGRP